MRIPVALDSARSFSLRREQRTEPLLDTLGGRLLAGAGEMCPGRLDELAEGDADHFTDPGLSVDVCPVIEFSVRHERGASWGD